MTQVLSINTIGNNLALLTLVQSVSDLMSARASPSSFTVPYHFSIALLVSLSEMMFIPIKVSMVTYTHILKRRYQSGFQSKPLKDRKIRSSSWSKL